MHDAKIHTSCAPRNATHESAKLSLRHGPDPHPAGHGRPRPAARALTAPTPTTARHETT